MVGIGTALADDPQLNARIAGVPRQPRRVVFDSEGRLPLDSQLVRGAPELPLTVVVGRAASRLQTDALEAAGADVIVATGENEPARVRSALDQLGAAGVTSILLEGGPKLAGAFLDAGEVDEIRLFLAPVVRRRLQRARPARGRGRGADRRGRPRARARRRADRRRRADLRPAAGSGEACSPGWSRTSGRSTAVDATGDGVTLGRAHAARGRDRRGRLGRRQRRLPDRDGDRRRRVPRRGDARDAAALLARPRRRPAPTSTSSCRCAPSDRLGGHIVQGHVDGARRGPRRPRGRVRPRRDGRARRPSCCATSSRRARSPSTACRSRSSASARTGSRCR